MPFNQNEQLLFITAGKRNPSTGKEIRMGATDMSPRTYYDTSTNKPTKYYNWRPSKPYG